MSQSTLSALPSLARIQPQRTDSDWRAIAGLSLTTLLSSLGTGIALVGLPTLAQTFGASLEAVQWVVLAYLLTVTSLMVGVGRLGDLAGRRRLLLIGIAVFTVASAFCGMAPSLAWLITARAVQGLGGAMIMVMATALVGETLLKRRTGTAMGLLGTMSAVGTALGPTLGGLLLSTFGWRALFLVNLPLGLLAWVLARSYVRRDRPRLGNDAGRFNLAGTALLAVTLAAYALALTARHGRYDSSHAALLLLALLATALFRFTEARSPTPVLPWSALQDRGLRTGLVLNAVVSMVIMATMVVGPFYLSRALALSPALVGLALSVGPIVAALTGIPAGHVVDRFGARRITLLGLVGIATACGALALISPALGVAGYLGSIALVTSSYALFQTANNAGVMAAAGLQDRGLNASLLNLSRHLGLIGGASAMSAVFALAAATSDFAAASPEAVATGMRITFGVAGLLMLGAISFGRMMSRSPAP